jgi:hypothetical protein
MSKPTDTLALQKSLEQAAATAISIRRTIASALDQINASGVADVATALANAAIAAGMPRSRAFDYAEEYASMVSKAKRELTALLEHAGQPGNAVESLEALVRIATLVPYRCPNHGINGGTRVLMLEG